MSASGERIGAVCRALRSAAAEILLTGVVLAGWAALTIGVRMLVPRGAAAAVWPTSTGLLLFSACGWRFLGRLACIGLYAATRREDGR